MSNNESSHELTTTLHLNSHPESEPSPAALIDGLLEGSNAEEQSVLAEIISGSGDRAMVFIHRGPSRGARFLITPEGVSIGRAPSNEIFLDDVTVSRKHATISYVNSRFTFSDSGSLNGSYINSKQSTSHSLVTGDEIQIGKFHLLFIGAKEQGEK